ncbi:hypothetical protein C6W19_12915 [Bacillus sp. RJGP41]|nr:hypothetical protein C6W19_12915 [Bacillus sp. RJGP41]
MILPTVFLRVSTIETLISTPGTRFPRAVGEPPRLAPAGSPLDTLFPQESRTFRFNQLVFFLKAYCRLRTKGASKWINPNHEERKNCLSSINFYLFI